MYFRCLLVGYFEGFANRRGIARRVADSAQPAALLGLALDTPPQDHSTLAATGKAPRRRRTPRGAKTAARIVGRSATV
jgi:hypothetical protein